MGRVDRLSFFEQYKRRVNSLSAITGTAADSWRDIYDWYKSCSGRDLFTQAFRHETSITVNPEGDSHNRIGAALPKSWADYGRKIKSDKYYKTHAEMFVNEMNMIVSRVPREYNDPSAEVAFGNVHRFVRRVLFESVVLFRDWEDRRANVPGVFGAGRSESTHLVNFYHGARQTIYSHGSFGLSMGDNHSELAVATIRQAVEIRLRRAFGLIGKESVSDGAFHPVPISELLAVLSNHATEVKTPIPLYNLVRINSWANLLLHSGMRDYVWTQPRVLDYLRPLLVGGETVNDIRTVNSGIRLTRSSFDTIQQTLKSCIERVTEPGSSSRFRAVLLGAPECDVVFENDSPTPAL